MKYSALELTKWCVWSWYAHGCFTQNPTPEQITIRGHLRPLVENLRDLLTADEENEVNWLEDALYNEVNPVQCQQ